MTDERAEIAGLTINHNPTAEDTYPCADCGVLTADLVTVSSLKQHGWNFCRDCFRSRLLEKPKKRAN